ncbi:hypothetical protein ACFO6V_27985 [Promicromonospora alba]|uniref:Uncharacterized protein n=1 Tax=Promicromonospora alba TaxID=1616110 RepID=A0ABV9HPI2_9MICO
MTMNLSPGTTSSIPVIAGESYTGSWYAKKSAGTINTYMAVTWFSSVGSIITGNTGSNYAPTTTWTRYSETWEAPEHAAFAQPSIRWSGTATSGQTLDFAQAQWEKTATLDDYFDGDYPDSEWSGTPNASSSVTDISNIVRHTPALVFDYSTTRGAGSIVHETLASGYPYTSLRAPQSRTGTLSTVWDSRAAALAAEAALSVPERFQFEEPEEDIDFFFIVSGDLTLEAIPGTDYWIIRINFREVSP